MRRRTTSPNQLEANDGVLTSCSLIELIRFTPVTATKNYAKLYAETNREFQILSVVSVGHPVLIIK